MADAANESKKKNSVGEQALHDQDSYDIEYRKPRFSIAGSSQLSLFDENNNNQTGRFRVKKASISNNDESFSNRKDSTSGVGANLAESDSAQLDNSDGLTKGKFNVTKLSPFDVASSETDDQLDTPLTPDDAVPNPNNYKNMMSLAAGEMRSRPTLLELQNHRGRASDTESLSRRNQIYASTHDFKSLNDLNNNKIQLVAGSSDLPGNQKSDESSKNDYKVIKFGWIKGVLIRCILNIFGVMIFLRVSWLVGQAGVGLMSVMILLATLVTVITALSMSAICTNGEVRGGGAYYLISRSLGPEFGGAIGIVFSFANAVAAAMYVIGFAETLVQLFRDNGGTIQIFADPTNDIRIIGFITNTLLLGIALIGMTWEAKVQLFLLGILVLSFINFLVGSFLPATDERIAKGIVGYSAKLLAENFSPNFRDGEDFAHLFGVFFPAVTGILAGANISGNLKNPQIAIPKGTLLSILITSAIYLLFSWICGATVFRDASGIIETATLNGTYCLSKIGTNESCKYGLMNTYNVMSQMSVYSPIIAAGIFSASLSSALASLVSAPKVFQAVCQDKIFPRIDFFAVGHGKDNEPWRGYFLTYFIACAFISLGELNVIAPIISNFFLMSYALVNFSCFDASISKTPGWRPAFKYYNKWISLFGALLCITVMFLIEWWAALITFVAIATLYFYVKQSKPTINWGSSTQAHIYRRSLEYSLKLMNIEEHVKNFRPNCLVLTGTPANRPGLVDFVSALTKSRSLMICANVILQDDLDQETNTTNMVYDWLRKRRVKSFYTEVRGPSLRSGVSSAMQCTGIGKLKPNTLVIGFKNDWATDQVESVLEYFEIINDAFSLEFAICILRLEGGLDYSDILDNLDSGLNDLDTSSSESDYSEAERSVFAKNNMIINESDQINEQKEVKIKMKNIENLIAKQNKSYLEKFLNLKNGSSAALAELVNLNDSSMSKRGKINSQASLHHLYQSSSHLINQANLIQPPPNNPQQQRRRSSVFKSTEVIRLRNTRINQGALQGINMFHRKYQNGFVDVWWLYDDGGLTILLPYLLMKRKYWQKCKLRIFIQTKNPSTNISEEQRNMATLLSKFRIEFHDLIVFCTLNKKPQATSISFYEKMIENWRLKANESAEVFPWKITDTMYKQNQEKINQHLVLRELLVQYSQSSNIIFMTIPVPSRMSTCAGLYLSFLDLISYQMPPMLMVRGNQNPVLTYYS